MNINIITVTYGNRFAFLEKVLDSVIKDSMVDKIILVDNGSSDAVEIDSYIKNNKKKKIVLIRNKENKGSAGGYKTGILEARKYPSDYVLLLDDDNVMEDKWSEYFVDTLNYFPEKDNVILKANRNEKFFVAGVSREKDIGLKISIWRKMKDLFQKTKRTGIFQPIIYMPHGAWSYGGTLLPFKAIMETEPPFEPFYVYYDDAEYLMRISKKGYRAYQLSRPAVSDIDRTFSNDSLFLTSFDAKASLIKIYFRIRNQYAAALMTKSQGKFSLFFDGILVISGKIIYAFIKLGINRFTIERSKIIVLAFWNGMRLQFNTEEDVKKYTGPQK